MAKQMPIQQVVQDKEWQKIRKGLLGMWSKNCPQATLKLEDYLLMCMYTRNFPFAVRRVYNYMRGSYFRIHGKSMCSAFLDLFQRVKKTYNEEYSYLAK